MKASEKKLESTVSRRVIVATIAAALLFFVATLLLSFLLRTQTLVYRQAEVPYTAKQDEGPEPFPVGVDPKNKSISENPTAEVYLSMHVAPEMLLSGSERRGWLGRTVEKLAQLSWYQNLASVSSRILIIRSGERKEEIVKNFGSILGWDTEERKAFLTLVSSSTPETSDGKFFPMTYLVPRDAGPETVAALVNERFKSEVLARYSDDVHAIVPLGEALTIASLLEREAYHLEDMRQIAGVIWNRQFIDMNLQIDATLQYAKANAGGSKWWPPVYPRDKFIPSPFNTYENEGLPPSPIANPSIEAIFAALNPRETECMFYFHDADGGFHCTPTYEEHVALLKEYYGRGK